MVSEVERAIQTHSHPSPVTSANQSRIFQEDIQRLDSKVEVSLRAFSREVEELREQMTQSIEGQASQASREKEGIRQAQRGKVSNERYEAGSTR